MALVQQGTMLVCCRNANRWQAETLAPCRGFHVVRDPRMWRFPCIFSHKHSHRLGPWFEFLGILESLSWSRLGEILNVHDFRAKTGGRDPGEEDVLSHYRKGVHGDWANHCTPRLVRHFKDKYNDLLLKLGYEHQKDW